VQVGELGLEREMEGAISGNVTSPSGASSITVESATR
jgi:hypothetical protein